jgi:hypothetical protein
MLIYFLKNNDMEIEIKSTNDVLFVLNLHDLFDEMYDREKYDTQKRPVYIPEKFVNTVWYVELKLKLKIN